MTPRPALTRRDLLRAGAGLALERTAPTHATAAKHLASCRRSSWRWSPSRFPLPINLDSSEAGFGGVEVSTRDEAPVKELVAAIKGTGLPVHGVVNSSSLNGAGSRGGIDGLVSNSSSGSSVTRWRWNSTSPASCGRSPLLAHWQRQRAGTSRSTLRHGHRGLLRCSSWWQELPTTNEGGPSPSAIASSPDTTSSADLAAGLGAASLLVIAPLLVNGTCKESW